MIIFASLTTVYCWIPYTSVPSSVLYSIFIVRKRTLLKVFLAQPVAYSFRRRLSISFCTCLSSSFEIFPISFVLEFLTIVTVISYEKSFAKALIAESLFARLSSASFLVIPAAFRAGSSAAIPGIRTYISFGISIYISTFLILYVANCILLISVVTPAD